MNRQAPRIKRHFSIIGHSPDTVEIRHGTWNPISFTINDESESGNLFRLLKRLDGSVAISELAKQEDVPRSEIEALLDHLIQLDVIEFGPSNAFDYYLDTLAAPLKYAGGQKGLDRSLLLLGDHELCQEIHRLLAGSLIDSSIEEVERDCHQWQLLKENDNSWLLDGLAFERNMSAFSNWSDKFVIFAKKKINPIQLQIWNRISLYFGIPWIHAAADGPFLLIGPTFAPPHSVCYECLEMRILMNLRENASYVAYKEALVRGHVKEEPWPLEKALLGVLASHASLEASNFWLTRSTFTLNKILAIYLPTMEFTFNEVLKVPGCPACGSSSERDDQEVYFDMRQVVAKG